MRIRPETDADRAAIHAVNKAAFPTPAEADLVEVLRRRTVQLVSLVAEVDGEIVGHILFSPVSLTGHPQLNLMGLGPMAVVPPQQHKGVGSALVREGLRRCKQLGCHGVVVLGHPDYYPRFGFIPASRYKIRSEYAVPEGVFMITELKPGSLGNSSGVIHYDEAFGITVGL
jgi:putative acetyltransferase